MKNLKISKNLKVLAVAGVMFTVAGIGIDKAYFSDSKLSNVNLSTNMEDSSNDLEYIQDNLNYGEKHDLVLFDSVKDDILNKKLFIEKEVVTDVKVVNDRIKFQVDNILLTDEEKKDFVGLVNYSDKVNYILYKVNHHDDSYSVEKIVTDDINIEGVYYVDPDNYVELVDPQQGYFINGKIRKKD